MIELTDFVVASESVKSSVCIATLVVVTVKLFQWWRAFAFITNEGECSGVPTEGIICTLTDVLT